MKKMLLLFAVLVLTPGVAELNAATYLEGEVVSMHSVPCGSQAKSHKRLEQMLCEQYLLHTDAMDYVIRQELPKEVNVLPVGQIVYFRVKKNRMLIRGYTLNGQKIHDQEYVVLSERQASGMATPGTP
jgi:hypothetical protein